MANVNEPWLSFWSARTLPVLLESRNVIQGMLRRADQVHPRELADVIYRDPLLLAQLLRLINQREKTALTSDVCAVESAIMLVGVAPFLERFSQVSTVESLLIPDHPTEYAHLMRRIFEARLSRRLAREFANQRYDARLDEIQAAALLHDMDEILSVLAPVLEKNAPGMINDPGALLASWEMPNAMLELICRHPEPSPRVALQHAVLPLARMLERGWWQNDVQHHLATIAATLNHPLERVWQTLTRHLLRFARNEGRSKHLYTPARWLAMLPGEWPKPVQQIQVQGNAPVETAQDRLKERMHALHLAGIQGAPTNQVMALAVRAIAEGLDMKRIAFTLLMAAENSLRARYVQGVDPADPLRTLHIRLDKVHVFTRLLQKPQSIWLNQGNFAQYAPHVPADFIEQAGSTEFCAMSIFVGNKPVGLIFADCGAQGVVTEYQYSHFKQICTLASKALAHNVRS